MSISRLPALLLATTLVILPFGAVAAQQRIATYYSGGVPVQDIPVSKLDSIIYAFVEPNDAGRCRKPTKKQKHILAQLRHLRAQHPHLKILFSVGGWASAPQFSDIALTKGSRLAFARSCIERYIVQQHLDGFDLDWEFPVHGGVNESRPSDRKHFTALTRVIREELDKLGKVTHRHYILTAATPAGRYEKGGPYVVTDSYNLAAIAPMLDWFNVMTYDFGTAFSPISTFNAPLHASPDNPLPEPQRSGNNVAAAIALYESHGVPASKIMLGVPFYGRGYAGVSSENAGLFSKYTKASWGGSWSEIKSRLLTNPAWVRHWSKTAQAPWLYNAEKHVFLSYEDPMSIGIKAKFAKKENLRGAMIWILGADDAQYSLLDSLASHLSRDIPKD